MTDKQEPVGIFRVDRDIGHVQFVAHQGEPLKDGDLLYRAAPPAQPAEPPMMQDAMGIAMVQAWDRSDYSTGDYDAVHPQYQAAFTAGWKAAQPAPAQELQWINVADRMPNPGVVVLAFHKNSAGHGRRIRAAWVPAKTEEAHSESDFGEYDEETDCYYAPEGWYEQMEHWPEYTSCMVCGVEITHWMLLPAAPKASHDPR